MTEPVPKRLPVLRILRETFAIPWRMSGMLFKALLPTSLILIAAQIMLPLMQTELGRHYSLPVAAVLVLSLGALLFALL